MLDAFGFTPNGLGNTQIFNRPSRVTNTQWMTWIKPRGLSMAHIIGFGGGGGGGGGFSAAAGNARGGGGAGGSSGVTRVTIPLFLIPDMLYIQVGVGGLGGPAGTGGTDGELSYVSIAPNTTATNVLLICPNGTLGNGGSGTAAGTGGSAGAAGSISQMPLAGLGQFATIGGQAGAAGGAQTGAIGVAIAIPVTSTLCQGGSGGAGTTSADFAGGECTAIANSWLSQQRPATPAAGSFNGSGGPQIWKPFFSFGGLGGSSSNTGLGGNGGNGAHGAGGGGGGGGTTGGRGGDGGGGIVIIICW